MKWRRCSYADFTAGIERVVDQIILGSWYFNRLHLWFNHSWKKNPTKTESLLSGTTDPVERARLLAASSEGSGDWLEALPIASIGLKLDDSSVRIAVGLKLGTPLVHPHQCCCGTIVTSDRHHGLSCRKSAGRQSRHSQINEIIHRAFIGAGVLATREPVGLCNSTYCETSRRSHHGPVEERPLSGMGCDLPRQFREFAYSNVQCFCWFSRENCGRQETREILRPHRWNWFRAHSHRINRRLRRARLWTSSRTRSSADCSELWSKIDVISATANFASGAARERLLRSGNFEKK